MKQEGDATMSDFASEFGEKTRSVLAVEENRQKVADLAYNNYKISFGCSQSMLAAFQEVLDLRDDFWLKALGGLQGGGSS
jgi:hypothetical protein